MVHASNPRLMNRVIDAVARLCEGKGSTARNVLDFLRLTSKTTPRNLTMQVHRALKHAVNIGLLRHRSGRYKALFALNLDPLKGLVNDNNDEKSIERTSKNAQSSSKNVNSNDKKKDRERHAERNCRRKRERSHSGQRRGKRSESRGRDNLLKHARGIRKRKYKEKDEDDRLPRYNVRDRRKKPDIGNASRFSSNRKRSKARHRDRTSYSDLSDSSEDK